MTAAKPDLTRTRELLAEAADEWIRTRDDRPCSTCGRPLTSAERERMDLDIDFVEHHEHLIGRLPRL